MGAWRFLYLSPSIMRVMVPMKSILYICGGFVFWCLDVSTKGEGIELELRSWYGMRCESQIKWLWCLWGD